MCYICTEQVRIAGEEAMKTIYYIYHVTVKAMSGELSVDEALELIREKISKRPLRTDKKNPSEYNEGKMTCVRQVGTRRVCSQIYEKTRRNATASRRQIKRIRNQ